jgi:purine-nucleoside phosphorylase
MSTVLEAIALRDLGVRVLGLSCITNYGAGVSGAVLDHEHVQATANEGAANMERLIVGLVESMFGSSQ